MEKLLPQNVEAEQSVLGSIIIDPEAIVQVCEFLQPIDFYRDAHRTIYEAILRLYQQHEPPDFITICDELDRLGKLEDAGGASYITSLVNCVPTSGNVEFYGHIVEREAVMRRLIHAAGQIAANAYERDPQALLKAEEVLYRISQGRKSVTISDIGEVLSRYQNKLDDLHGRRVKGVVTGIPTGFSRLDGMTGGLQKTDLVTLAARPGIGKTSMSLNIARTAYIAGLNVLFFSIEMAEEQLAQRLLAIDTGIDQARLRVGDIDSDEQWRGGTRYESEWDIIVEKIDYLSETRGKGRLWIDDSTRITPLDMYSRAKKKQAEAGLDLIIVDYMQKVKTTTRQADKRLEVTEVADDLKALARDLQVPVLALAQLSRASENTVPMMSHLKEAGAIEENSDIVAFIHVEDDQLPKKQKSQPYNVNVILAKHRNGPVGAFPLHFIPYLTRYVDIVEEKR